MGREAGFVGSQKKRKNLGEGRRCDEDIVLVVDLRNLGWKDVVVSAQPFESNHLGSLVSESG